MEGEPVGNLLKDKGGGSIRGHKLKCTGINISIGTRLNDTVESSMAWAKYG